MELSSGYAWEAELYSLIKISFDTSNIGGWYNKSYIMKTGYCVNTQQTCNKLTYLIKYMIILIPYTTVINKNERFCLLSVMNFQSINIIQFLAQVKKITLGIHPSSLLKIRVIYNIKVQGNVQTRICAI